jgi:hypothetical protein
VDGVWVEGTRTGTLSHAGGRSNCCHISRSGADWSQPIEIDYERPQPGDYIRPQPHEVQLP